MKIGTGVAAGRGVAGGVGAAVIIKRGVTVGVGDGEETSRGRVGDGEAICENVSADKQMTAKKTSKTVFFIQFSGNIEIQDWLVGRT